MDGTFTNASLGVESMMRQLSYEAITISVAAIKQRIEPTVEAQVKHGCCEKLRLSLYMFPR